MRPRWTTLALVGLAAALSASCSEPTLTEVLIVVDTDLDVPDDVARLTFRVLGPTDEQQAAVTDFAAGDPRPAILALVHRGGPLGPFTVSVTGERGNAEVVRRRRARFSFVEGRTLVMRLDLLRSCGGVSCEPDETCGATGCRSIDVDPSELTDWNGAPPPPADAGGMPDGGPSDGGVEMPDARVGCMAGDPCDDGVECTVDRCEDGVCINEPDDTVCPDDGVECTLDRCDPARGCVSEPDDASCADGVDCTADVCDPTAGCTSTPDDAACSDGVSCTTDSCDPALGCSSTLGHETCPPGELCDAAFTLSCSPGPTFTEVYSIITTECRPCHTQGPSFGGNLDMSTRAAAYAGLVGVTADCGMGTDVLVIPRDARRSLLWRKLADVDLCGSPMPREQSRLPAEEIDLIERWISAGALDN